MKRKWILFTVVMILLIIGFIYYFWFGNGKKEVPVSFVMATAQYGYIAKSVTATGTIQPVDTVSVGAQVSGLVKSVLVDFNNVVKKGQLLAQVDPTILKAQNQESIANLANAKSNLVFQQSTFVRQKKLFALGAISSADFQLALNQYNSANAAVGSSLAQLKVTAKTLSYTNIYSPVNGVVLNRNISAGQTIASSFNAPVLFVIAKDLTKMQANAAVDEADIGGVSSNQNVSFTVDAFPNEVFNGRVREILLHPAVSANVVTYSTLIDVDNPGLQLKPGMTASINIYTEEDSNALLVPSRALNYKPDSLMLKNYKIVPYKRDNTGNDKLSHKNNRVTDSLKTKGHTQDEIQSAFLWVKHGDTLTQLHIIIGLNDDSFVKIIKGVSPGEEVVVSANTVEKGAKTAIAQKSPFMPTMGARKPSANPKNK